MSKIKSLLSFWKPVNETKTQISQCSFCRHRHKLDTCDAFPDGISSDVMKNKVLHNKSIEGDNGLLYRPKDPRHKKIQFIPFDKK